MDIDWHRRTFFNLHHDLDRHSMIIVWWLIRVHLAGSRIYPRLQFFCNSPERQLIHVQTITVVVMQIAKQIREAEIVTMYCNLLGSTCLSLCFCLNRSFTHSGLLSEQYPDTTVCCWFVDLGPPCCSAISTILYRGCWRTMNVIWRRWMECWTQRSRKATQNVPAKWMICDMWNEINNLKSPMMRSMKSQKISWWFATNSSNQY